MSDESLEDILGGGLPAVPVTPEGGESLESILGIAPAQPGSLEEAFPDIPIPETQPEPSDSDFLPGIARGALGIASNTLNLFGAEETAEELKDYTAREFPQRIDPLEVDTLGEGVDLIQGATGELLPSIGVTVGGAAVGGKVGAVIGALGGPAAPATIPLGASIGAGVGTFISSFILNAGETKTTLQEEGIEPTAEKVVSAGIVKAIPDSLLKISYLKALGFGPLVDKAVGKAAHSSGLFSRLQDAYPKLTGAAKGVLAGELGEVPTEVFQDFIDQATVNISKGIDATDLSQDQKDSLKRTAIFTAAGVLIPGGAGGIVTNLNREQAIGVQPDGSLKTIIEQEPVISVTPPTVEEFIGPPTLSDTIVEQTAAVDQLIVELDRAGENATAVPQADEGVISLIPRQKKLNGVVGSLPVNIDVTVESPLPANLDTIGELNDFIGSHITIDQATKDSTRIGQTAESTNLNAGEVVVAGFKQTQQAQDNAKSTARVLQQWVKQFAPNMKLVLLDPAVKDVVGEKYTQLEGVTDSYGSLSVGLDNTYYLTINNTNIERTAQELRSNAELGAHAVLAHEFGHALIGYQIQELEQQARAGDTSAQNQISALYSDYHDFLNDTQNSDLTVGEFFGKWYAAGRQELLRDTADIPLSIALARRGKQLAGYTLGFDEFAAHQVAKYMDTKGSYIGRAKPIWQKVLTALRSFFHLSKNTDYKPAKNFESFLDLLANKQKLRELELNEQAVAGIEAVDKKPENIDEVVTEHQDKLINMLPTNDRPQKTGHARFNKFIRIFASLPQIGIENAHVPGVTRYVDAVRNWWTEKTHWTNKAVVVTEAWEKAIKGKAENKRFSQALYQMTLESDEAKQTLSDERILEILKENGVESVGAFELIQQIQQEFNDSLTGLYDVLERDAKVRLRDNQTALAEKLQEYQTEKGRLLNRNFFPLSRFGEFWVHVRAKKDVVIDKQLFKAGQTIRFEMFESEKAMRQGLKEAKAHYGEKNAINSAGKVSEELKAFRGIPPQLLRSIADRVEMTEGQRAELNLLLHELAPGQSYRKHMLHRKGTAGFSVDAKRTFANYFMHFSNHISRINNSSELNGALDDLKAHRDNLELQQGQVSIKETELLDYLRRHYEYAMSPGEEWAALRSAGFLWYLGFMPKSAFVNLTQVPLVTYPYLASRYGDAKTVKYLTSAMKDISRSWKTAKGIETALDDAIQRGIEGGFLNESLATELAGISEGSNLSRLIPGTGTRNERGARMLRKAAYWGAFLFQKAEGINRFQSYAAAWRLSVDEQLGQAYSDKGRQAALDKMNDMEREALLDKAFRDGRAAVEQTQYEYARWARPEFMRGRKSVIFLFWQYMQNTLYFAARDPGRVRFLLMLTAMAGLGGVPFAEDLMDVIDAVATKMKATLGYKNPKVDVRNDIRAFAKELNLNPDLVMHGLSRESFGIPHVTEMMGIPFPRADLSGSLSLGRIVPGVEPLFGREGKVSDRFLEGAEDVGGAFVSIPLAVMRSLADDNPDTFKRWERSLPSALRSISRASRFARDGEEKTRQGATIARFDVKDPEQLAEIVIQGLGAAPSRINQERELRWTQQEHARYYQTRRTMIMMQFDYARQSRDPEAIADARRALRSYNLTVPHPALRIRAKDLRTSVKNRQRTRALQERNLPSSRKERGLFRQIEENF